jgi:predicted nucleic acid-binding Zn ribbon protein
VSRVGGGGRRPVDSRHVPSHGGNGAAPSDQPPPGRSPAGHPRGLERLADLLPQAARNLGLEPQLEHALAAAAWERILVERVPAAVGACRLRSLDRGVAMIEADLPIVGQEIRIRSTELLAALREAVSVPIVSLQVALRHV